MSFDFLFVIPYQIFLPYVNEKAITRSVYVIDVSVAVKSRRHVLTQQKTPQPVHFKYVLGSLLAMSYTNSRSTSSAPSPFRCPIFTILVYPPLRPAYLGAISVKSLSGKSTCLVFFFLPAASLGTSFTG